MVVGISLINGQTTLWGLEKLIGAFVIVKSKDLFKCQKPESYMHKFRKEMPRGTPSCIFIWKLIFIFPCSRENVICILLGGTVESNDYLRSTDAQAHKSIQSQENNHKDKTQWCKWGLAKPPMSTEKENINSFL